MPRTFRSISTSKLFLAANDKGGITPSCAAPLAASSERSERCTNDLLGFFTMKICCTCKTEKQLSSFGKNAGEADGLQKRCKECRIIESRERRHKHREKLNSYDRDYREKNRPRIKLILSKYYTKHRHILAARATNWRKENADRYNELARIRSRRHTTELSDSHIKYLLTQRTRITTSEIPQALIESKRLQISIKRLLKETI